MKWGIKVCARMLWETLAASHTEERSCPCWWCRASLNYMGKKNKSGLYSTLVFHKCFEQMFNSASPESLVGSGLQMSRRSMLSMGQRNLSAATCVVGNKVPLWASIHVALVTERAVHPWGSVTDGEVWGGWGRWPQHVPLSSSFKWIPALHQKEAAEEVVASGMLTLFWTCTCCSASHGGKCHSHEKRD